MTVLDPATLDFLRRPLFARLSTNGRDGYPHTVPIWYDVDVDESGHASLWFISDRSASKTRNAIADGRAAAVVGGDPSDGGGYLFRGLLSVEDDPGQGRTHHMIDRYEQGARNAELRDEWEDDDIVVLRLRIQRVSKVF